MKDKLRIPFDPEAEAMFCSRCGWPLARSSHMWTEFLMCPMHGEFTIAPTVMREPTEVMGPPPDFEMIPNPSPDAGKWFIHADETFLGMWENCKAVDARHTDGSEYHPGETRVG